MTTVEKLQACLDLGISQRKLAKRIGIDQSHISRLLNGQRPNLQLTTAVKIDRAYRALYGIQNQ